MTVCEFCGAGLSKDASICGACGRPQDTTSAGSEHNAMPGGEQAAPAPEIVGFCIEFEIGRGGMGIVYKAWEERLARYVAIKIISPHLANDEGFRARFESESQIAASIDDPHVLPIYQAGEAGGVLFMSMPLIEDGDLGTALLANDLGSAEDVSFILGKIAQGLDAAHDNGLIHRDVKPPNVLLEKDDGKIARCFLSDFGLSKAVEDAGEMTATGEMIGSPDYMSPEQISGTAIGKAADQYALACLSFRMLFGFVPYQRDTKAATLIAHLQDEPAWPKERHPIANSAVRRVIGKALAKDPDSRYGSCGEFVGALNAELMPEQVLPELSPSPPRPVRNRKRTRRRLALAGFMLIALAAGSFVLLNDSEPAVAKVDERISFWNPKTERISTMDMMGKDLRGVGPKTPKSTNWQVSPTGNSIAVWKRGKPGQSRVTVRSLNGKFEPFTSKGVKAVFSSDGRRVCTMTSGASRCHDLFGSDPPEAVDGRIIEFLPDSQVALAERIDGDDSSTWLIDTTAEERPIKLSNGRPFGLLNHGESVLAGLETYSRDGVKQQVKELCNMSVSGDEARDCFASGADPNFFSTQGPWVLFKKKDGIPFKYNTASQKGPEVFSGLGYQYVATGKENLVFLTSDINSPYGPSLSLQDIRFGGTSQLWNDSGLSPSLSETGQFIVFSGSSVYIRTLQKKRLGIPKDKTPKKVLRKLTIDQELRHDEANATSVIFKVNRRIGERSIPLHIGSRPQIYQVPRG